MWPAWLAADSAYGSAEHPAWLAHECGIEPHIPVFDKSQRSDGTFIRLASTYDHAADAHIWPAGKQLRQCQEVYRTPPPFVDEDGMMRHGASKCDCDACALKSRCYPNTSARKAPRSIHRGARQIARHICATSAPQRMLRQKISRLDRTLTDVPLRADNGLILTQRADVKLYGCRRSERMPQGIGRVGLLDHRYDSEVGWDLETLAVSGREDVRDVELS